MEIGFRGWRAGEGGGGRCGRKRRVVYSSANRAPGFYICTSLGVRGRLEEWLKNLKYSWFSAFGQRLGHALSPEGNSRIHIPHVLHLGSNSQVRISKYAVTPTTTTKTVSVLVPISELSCSTCIPHDAHNQRCQHLVRRG